MKRFFFFLVVICVTVVACAQSTDVSSLLLRSDILRAKFDSMCSREVPLKIAEAERRGLDSLQTLVWALAQRRKQLAYEALVYGEIPFNENSSVLVKHGRKRNTWQIRAVQIFKHLPQNIPSIILRKTVRQMDSLHLAVLNGESFEQCVQTFSDEKEPFWISPLEVSAELESKVIGMKEGEVSEPFFTPQGIHIVKVLEKKQGGVNTDRHLDTKTMDSLLARLKKRYNYAPNEQEIKKCIGGNISDKPLFTLQGVSYTATSFSRFASSHPGSRKRQFQSFLQKTLLDKAYLQVEEDCPAVCAALKMYRDSMLVRELCYRQLTADKVGSEASLEAYFEMHKKKYSWNPSRYKGVVIHAVNKRVAKEARKFLKKLPFAEWEKAVRLVFLSDETQKIKAEIGVFAPGDNVYVDDLIFKKKHAPSLESHPFTVVVGKKIKGPVDYREVHDILLSDSFDDWEKEWVTVLKELDKLEVNKEHLKTVNYQ